MPEFFYRGVNNTDGGEEVGSIEADNDQVAFEILMSRGVIVFELGKSTQTTARDVPWYRRELRLTGSLLPLSEQAVVAELLASLFAASIDAPEVARIVGKSSSNVEVARHFERVAQRLEDGADIGQAFDAENRTFSYLFVAFLSVSDKANALPNMMRQLAIFLRNQGKAQARVTSALLYPAILVGAAIAVLGIVIFYLAPSLEPIFSTLDKPPPTALSLLISANTLLSKYWWTALLCLVGAIVFISIILSDARLRRHLMGVLFAVPLVGKILWLSTLSRMTHSTYLLLSAGLPLADALRLSAENMSGGSKLGVVFVSAADFLEEGRSAHLAFTVETTGSVLFCEMFRVGETVNNLPSVLENLSRALDEQAESQSQKFLTMLLPLLTLVMGLGIGALVYFIMGAVFEVNELAF